MKCTREKVRGVGNRAVIQSTADRLGIVGHGAYLPRHHLRALRKEPPRRHALRQQHVPEAHQQEEAS